MRTPRRVPWTSQGELSDLFEWLFAPSADIGSRRRGLARMSVYISSPSCPAFIHLLHTLVSADLLPEPVNSAAAYATRLTCAMAIVRFINGMVDPLQTGTYARPISHLAASINIPASLISLRHRATHEDLPPLPLLRQSVIQAIQYIHTYSFLPLLASTSSQPIFEARDRAEKLVGRWKRLMKERIRDREVAEDTVRAKELRRVRRHLEAEEVDDVVEVLCGSEGLVPLARKKRPGKNDTIPSAAMQQVWNPLLIHLASIRPSYPSLIAENIVTILIEHDDASILDVVPIEDKREKEKERTSFRWTLATWLVSIWESSSSGDQVSLTDEEKRTLWSRIINHLLAGDPTLRRLASILAQMDPSLQDSWNRIAPMLLEPEETDILSGLDDVRMEEFDEAEIQLAEMEARLGQLQQVIRPSAGTEMTTNTSKGEVTAAGWKMLGSREWRACPMGMWSTA